MNRGPDGARSEAVAQLVDEHGQHQDGTVGEEGPEVVLFFFFEMEEVEVLKREKSRKREGAELFSLDFFLFFLLFFSISPARAC